MGCESGLRSVTSTFEPTDKPTEKDRNPKNSEAQLCVAAKWRRLNDSAWCIKAQPAGFCSSGIVARRRRKPRHRILWRHHPSHRLQLRQGELANQPQELRAHQLRLQNTSRQRFEIPKLPKYTSRDLLNAREFKWNEYIENSTQQGKVNCKWRAIYGLKWRSKAIQELKATLLELCPRVWK